MAETGVRIGLKKTGKASIGSKTPDPSAILDVSGTDGGVLMPRLNNAQRNAIVSPKDGLVIFNNTPGIEQFQVYQGGVWNKLELIGVTTTTSTTTTTTSSTTSSSTTSSSTTSSSTSTTTTP